MSWKTQITKEEFPRLSNYDIHYLKDVLTGLLKASHPNQEVFEDKDYIYQARLFEMDLAMQ